MYITFLRQNGYSNEILFGQTLAMKISDKSLTQHFDVDLSKKIDQTIQPVFKSRKICEGTQTTFNQPTMRGVQLSM